MTHPPFLSLQAITRSASISATMFPYGKKRHSLLLLWRWHYYGPLCQRRRRQPSPDCADLGRTHPAPRRTYESLLPSLLIPWRAFNHRLYIENGQIGEEKDLSKMRNSRQKSKRLGPLPFGESKMAMRLGQSNKRRYKSILGR